MRSVNIANMAQPTTSYFVWCVEACHCFVCFTNRGLHRTQEHSAAATVSGFSSQHLSNLHVEFNILAQKQPTMASSPPPLFGTSKLSRELLIVLTLTFRNIHVALDTCVLYGVLTTRGFNKNASSVPAPTSGPGGGESSSGRRISPESDYV